MHTCVVKLLGYQHKGLASILSQAFSVVMLLNKQYTQFLDKLVYVCVQETKGLPVNREDEKTCDTPPSCPGSKDEKMIQVSPDTMALSSLVRFFVSVKDNLRKCLLIVIFSLQLQ